MILDIENPVEKPIRSYIGDDLVWQDSSGFTPAELFIDGEQGVWLDPSDLSTMFQDIKGRTPVTRDGDPVGLILDKSQGIYGDIVFDDKEVDVVSIRWHTGTALSKTKRTFTSEGTGGPRFDFNLTEGKTYKIDLTISNETVVNFYGGTITGAASASNSIKLSNIFKATGSDNLYIRNLNAGTTTIEYLQIQELKGNHATQETAASRPIYRTDGELHWLEFDGVEDSLDVNISDTSSFDLSLSFNYKGLSAGFRRLVNYNGGGNFIFGSAANANFNIFNTNNGRLEDTDRRTQGIKAITAYLSTTESSYIGQSGEFINLPSGLSNSVNSLNIGVNSSFDLYGLIFRDSSQFYPDVSKQLHSYVQRKAGGEV